MDNKFYYDKLLEELLLNYRDNSIENIIKKNAKNDINNCNKINAVTFDLVKGTENLDKLNSGGLNENYDYLENDCNLKEKSELFLKELNITEEELNEEAINYHNTFTNIEIKKERLNNEYLDKVNNLKEELNKSINNLNNEFNINQNSFNKFL